MLQFKSFASDLMGLGAWWSGSQDQSLSCVASIIMHLYALGNSGDLLLLLLVVVVMEMVLTHRLTFLTTCVTENLETRARNQD